MPVLGPQSGGQRREEGAFHEGNVAGSSCGESAAVAEAAAHRAGNFWPEEDEARPMLGLLVGEAGLCRCPRGAEVRISVYKH